MLRDAGVRTKLLAVLAIPTLLLVAVTSLLVGGQVAEARRAGQINALTEVAVQVNTVVHSLQEERSVTLNHLRSPSAGTERSMRSQRRFTDQQLRELGKLVAASPVDEMSPAVRASVARSASVHGELTAARASIDAGRFFATETDVFYGRVIRTDLELPGVLATDGTADLGETLEAYQALSRTIEFASHERDLVQLALDSGAINEAGFAQASALVAQQRDALQDFQGAASPQTFARLDEDLAGAQNYEIDQVRRDLPDLLRGREPALGAATQWVTAANTRISPMTTAESELVDQIADAAITTQLGQERRALLVVSVAVLGLGLALMLAIGLARRITRPLRRLTAAAGDIGDELPRMVERMQVPGEGPGVTVEPIPVESRDEIGQLAEAFNTVNDVTVQVAKEQAALRASIAEMFVNVARRNQVLLGRQLKALDQMEAREEDPDVLERLFTLDHLATRMRRNAESLLVLAGIDSTRRLRGVLPLSDVIRTAVGEIEAFDRIDLSMTEDPEVSGRHALTVAHLLAELLENATHFSNPETRVVVAAKVTGRGVDVTVTDYGLGMSDDELAEANDKIAHPPVAEIAVSQRLGLFVVGRLASRLEATVELRHGRAAGTVVVLSLPASVFEGMTVEQPEEIGKGEQAERVEQVEHAEPSVRVGADDPVELADGAGEVDEAAVGAGAVAADAGHAADAEEALDAEEADDAEPDLVAGPEASVETDSDSDDTQEADGPASVADDSADTHGADLAEPVADAVPEPAPAVAPQYVFAPAVDVLPSHASSGGRFGRHKPSPARRSATAPTPETEETEAAPAAASASTSAPGALTPETTPETTPEQRPAHDSPVVDESTVAAQADAEASLVHPSAPTAVTPDTTPEQQSVGTSPSEGTGEVAGSRLPTRSTAKSARPEPLPSRSEATSARPEPLPSRSDALPAQVESLTARWDSLTARSESLSGPTAPAERTDPVGSTAPAEPTETTEPTEPASSTTAPAEPVADADAGAEAAAAEALSELRGLYEPTFVPAVPEQAEPTAEPALVRRTPKEAAATAARSSGTPGTPARTRSANEVRGMLSGFRAGVARGRATGEPADDSRTGSGTGTDVPADETRDQ